ncbi:restriction endonuclease subunit S [Clostridium beijerinckii]|uniref:Type I restriction modification DNA specificity domain-containing protein n=1 Tax=Clostridium beijerinckii TaxID=1520 RepID=A0A1S9NB50_CLOBE|nr:restriction endonuclease subunit S [Clostridium beijerinckii]OOP74678.1 hypothetical protein CBEIBR21_00490 [Clostridium beijerinckii]
MAKKKEKLSLEEMLEQALVNEEDRPYEVPENWVWTRLDNVAEYKKGPFGSAITKAMFVQKGENTYKIYEQGNAIRKDKNYGSYYISEEKYHELKGFTVYPNDLIVSCAGTVGEVYQLPEDIEKGIINQALMRIKVSRKVNLKYYLLYFSESLKIDITGKSKGTAIKNIPPFSILKNMPFPLPSIVEQQRIVDIIEQLFEKLDTAKELAQNALDSFENRKAAILHKAFTGELTAKWREENRVSLDDWEDTKMKNLTLLVTKGASPRWQGVNYIDDDSQTLFVTSENVREGFIDLQKEKYLENKINDIQKRSVLQMGDILLNIVGASIGRAAIFKINKLANINQAVCLIRLKDNVSKEFICNYLNAPSAMQYYSTNKVDVARANLSLTDVNNMSLLLPSIEEQKEIVRILDNLLDNEQRAKELCDVIEKIDLMKKAILSRAFRGRLGTNDSDEESAIELLKEVLREKI